jgi:hypothetical protein
VLEDVATGSGLLGAEAPSVSEQATSITAPNPKSKHARVGFTGYILSYPSDHVFT